MTGSWPPSRATMSPLPLVGVHTHTFLARKYNQQVSQGPDIEEERQGESTGMKLIRIRSMAQKTRDRPPPLLLRGGPSSGLFSPQTMLR